jgi:hypothetical protein
MSKCRFCHAERKREEDTTYCENDHIAELVCKIKDVRQRLSLLPIFAKEDQKIIQAKDNLLEVLIDEFDCSQQLNSKGWYHVG